MMIDPAEVAHRFAFHAAITQERRDEHSSVRQQCYRLAESLNDALPDGREKAVVLTKLEEVMFWANAAIARKGANSD